MLFAVNGLIGCPVAASDGDIGSVKDFLFDDRSWKVRWMTVDTGHWLPGRQVLIHPSAIAPLELPPKPALPMMTGGQTLTISVHLTKQQIDSSPDAREDAPCTRELEARLYNHYGIDPYWGDTYSARRYRPAVEADRRENAARQQALRSGAGDGDLYLGSVAEAKGLTVHATDGDLVRSRLSSPTTPTGTSSISSSPPVLAARQAAQLAPYAVTSIDWRDHRVSVNVTRDQVLSPAWDPVAMVDKVADHQLHQHFGWPGYGA